MIDLILNLLLKLSGVHESWGTRTNYGKYSGGAIGM